MQWVVVKFGGTSVSSGDYWQKIAKIINKHLSEGRRPLVVCSALSGVSNLLEDLLKEAASAKPNGILETIQQKYQQLALKLGIDCQDYLTSTFAELKQLIEGIRLTGEVTPRVHARVLAFGELILTHLGALYLQSQGINTQWQDARDLLQVEKHGDFRHPDAYLSARCASDPDPKLVDHLNKIQSDVVITQGFIAKNQQGDTVLLGRGGSDSSAAYLAAKIGAARCEIWTDVPGIYTANPKHIPEARLLTSLDYDEAQEISTMGAKVLHPKCISPVRAQGIPLYVRFTSQPERAGTEICEKAKASRSQIKSILTKHNIILITIETLKMWQQVGFLADVFQCFKRHGASIDLVSTSESSVTVSLDSEGQVQDSRVLDALLSDLNQFARAKVIAPCASISLVGRNIRSILHQLGGIFSVFEEQKIYLLSQAANDLNLTFVVDEDQAPRLASKLHNLLIEQNDVSEHFRLSWQEEFGEKSKSDSTWWQRQKQALLTIALKKSPLYIYSAECLKQRAQNLKNCDAIDIIYYSVKANNNSEVLKLFYQMGLGFECVSKEELDYVLKLFPEIEHNRISFTPNFAPKEEYQHALKVGVNVTIDSLFPFEHWAEVFANKDVLIRVDIGKGSGHHKYVVTGGDQSKFGIPLKSLDRVAEIAKDNNINIKGLHSHSGSGILNPLHWQKVFESLASLIEKFPLVKILNLGGGLGIKERRGQNSLDLMQLNNSLISVKANHPTLKLWMEPGRYLVAEAGVLLARVTQVKGKADLVFVGIETGMNSLIRPALYGSYHEIVNLTRLNEPNTQRVNIVGPICESGDTLGYSRWLPECREGDIILIANVGAYGYSMSSQYNLRQPAEEYYLA